MNIPVNYIVSLLFATLCLWPIAESWAQQTKPPNVVIILADDLGWNDVGFHGSEIRTPHIDALAASGTRLESFYVQPVCTQTRIALLTGRYPFRMGLHNRVIFPESTHGVPTEERMLSQELKDHGYTTAIIGKWHLGHAKPEYLPLARGFESHYGNYCGQVDYFTQSFKGKRDWFRNGEPTDEEGYVTELIAEEAVRFIRKSEGDDKPFFLYLPFTAPHGAVQATTEALKRVDYIKDPQRRTFAAAVTSLDDAVGQVVNALRSANLLDQTVLFFSSDNGGSPRTGSSNSPYRGFKAELLEGSIRVPTVISYSPVIPTGAVNTDLLQMVDLYPTLLDLAVGEEKGIRENLDGVSFLPLLRKESDNKTTRKPREILLAAADHRGAAFRMGEWKLIHRYSGERSLFNLKDDPAERKNLVDKRPEIVKQFEPKVEKVLAEIPRGDG